MAITYGTVAEVYEVGESKRISYGLAAYADVAEEGSACVLFAARDLSSSRASLEALAEKMNREDVSEDHFYEIVSDFLAEA